MSDLLTAVPRSVVGAIFLQLFFSELRTSWPANYYAVSDVVASGISRTWRRYALFRFAPVLVAAVVVGATGSETLSDIAASVGLMAALHIGLTTARSSARSIKRHTFTGRQVLSDLTVTLGVLITSAVGALLSQPVGRFLPGVDKYVEVLLTGVVAALAYAYLTRWTAGQSTPDSRSKLLSTTPASERAIAVERAAHYGVDQDFALALLATEYAQRPSWIGAMERAASWTHLVSTYGPLQNMPDANATAYDSIDRALGTVPGTVIPRQNGWVKNTAMMEAHFEQFNRSRVFIEQASAAMMVLSSSLPGQSDSPGDDGTPRLRCLRIRRVGYTWELEGDVSAGATQFSVLAMEPNVENLAVTEETVENRRRKWRSTCDLWVTKIHLIDAPLRQSSDMPEVLEIHMHAQGE